MAGNGNGHTPTPTPVQGVPYPMPARERSRAYGRRKSDSPWRRALATAARMAPVVVALATFGWWLAAKVVVTRADWNQARTEDAEFKGTVRANLQSLKESIDRIERTHR